MKKKYDEMQSVLVLCRKTYVYMFETETDIHFMYKRH